MEAAKRKRASQQQLLRERQLLQQKRAGYIPYQVKPTEVLGTSGETSSVKRGPTTHVDVDEFWRVLDKSSEAWRQIVKPNDKVFVVAHYIDLFSQKGTTITRQPSYYAAMIDDIIHNNPGLLSSSFSRLVQMAAIMEYDFNNGQDKDVLARQLLGEQAYLANRKRLSGR